MCSHFRVIRIIANTFKKKYNLRSLKRPLLSLATGKADWDGTIIFYSYTVVANRSPEDCKIINFNNYQREAFLQFYIFYWEVNKC